MATFTDPIDPTPDVTTLDQSNDSATTALYRAAIGPINLDYYLPIFSRFDASNRVSASWNPTACLATLNWMAFRNLWGAALIYIGAMVGASLMVFGIGRMIFQFSEMAEMALWLVFGAAAFVLPGVYGNALMHADLRKKMAAALSATSTMAQACDKLGQQAATRRRFIWLALSNLTLAGIVAGAYMTVAALNSLSNKPTAPPPITDIASKPAPASSAPSLVPTVLTPAPPASAPVAPTPSPAASSASAVTPTPAVSAASTSTSASTPPAVASSNTRASEVPQAPLKPTPPAPKPKPKAIAIPQPPAVAVATAPPVKKAAKTAHIYYVNVGLFAKESNAHNAHAKLTEAGLPTLKHVMKTAKGEVTRVRVGPFENRSQADDAATKIKALKLDALVLQQ